MAADILTALLKINVAAAAAILLVVVLRKPVRALLGARLAYGLWLLPLLAMAGALIPARRVVLPAPQVSALPAIPAFATGQLPAAPAPPFDPTPLLLGLWLAGVLAALLVMVRLQSRFAAEARRGQIGPAVVGVVRPRIITPADFAEKFDPEQQALVLAHEQAHLDREDSRLNGLAAGLQCLFWFNPFIHLGCHLMRIDQEMACDEAVVTRFPEARRAYADALVKAQLAIRPLPLGCYWPSGTQHPLLERIAMLNHPDLSRARRRAGAAALALLCAGAGVGAWAAQPARTQVLPARARIDLPAPVTPVRLAVLEPRALSPVTGLAAAPEPQTPANPAAIDLNAPATVEGRIARFMWGNPASEITVRDANGAERVISTDMASNLIAGGGTRETIRPGMPISARGYASADGSRLYADPSEITSGGASIFPKATPDAGMAQTVSQRMAACGTMPMELIVQANARDPASVEGVVNTWQGECDAKVAVLKAQQAKAAGGGKPAVITNSIAR